MVGSRQLDGRLKNRKHLKDNESSDLQKVKVRSKDTMNFLTISSMHNHITFRENENHGINLANGGGGCLYKSG